MAANSQDEEEELQGLTPISVRNTARRNSSEPERSSSDVEMEEMLEDETENEGISAMRRCKLWLGQQKIDYNTELFKCRLKQTEDLQAPSTDDGDDVSALYERITELQEELFSTASKKSYGKLVLERLLQGDMLLKILFPDILTENPNQEDIDKMNEFSAICTKNDDICSKILHHHKELTETQQKLNKVKQQNYEINKHNRELMAKLQTLKAKRGEDPDSESQALLRSKEEYQRLLSNQHDIANIFQALVVGSGINWAADDDTRKLVLSIGEMINTK